MNTTSISTTLSRAINTYNFTRFWNAYLIGGIILLIVGAIFVVWAHTSENIICILASSIFVFGAFFCFICAGDGITKNFTAQRNILAFCYTPKKDKTVAHWTIKDGYDDNFGGPVKIYIVDGQKYVSPAVIHSKKHTNQPTLTVYKRVLKSNLSRHDKHVVAAAIRNTTVYIPEKIAKHGTDKSVINNYLKSKNLVIMKETK